jgi:enamine deaminase RidA (YjgF/YER057c/UK114 family)
VPIHLFSAHPGSPRARLASDVATVNDWTVLLGVLPIDLKNERTPLPEIIEDQTMKVFENMDALLATAALGRENVVAVRVSLTDFDRLYERMNAAYAGCFPETRVPLRTCVGVTRLRRGALVEMDFYAIASKS